MAVTHLSDQEIQEYFDNKRAALPRVAAHIETCQQCQAQLQGYQELYFALRYEPELSTRLDLADAIMENLKINSEEAFNLPIWLAFFGMIIGLAATLYLVGVEKVVNSLMALQTYFSIDWHVVSTINKYLSGLHLNLGLLAMAVFIIVMMSIIDHFVFQSRHKLISFFK